MQKSVYFFILLVITLTVLLWAPLYPVLAQDSTSSGSNRKLDRLELRQDVIKQKQDNINKIIDNVRLKIASREALLKDRLAKFKDQRKADIAQKVSVNLNNINKNRTDAMLAHLDTLSMILSKVQDQASSSATQSSDSAIASASASIATARNAVNVQAQKDYTINATSEALLSSEVKTERDLLFKDLSGVRQAVLDSRQAVIAAIMTIVQEKGKN